MRFSNARTNSCLLRSLRSCRIRSNTREVTPLMSKRTRAYLVIVVLLGAMAVTYQVSLSRQTASDNEMILAAIEKAQTSAEKNDARGVLSVVSKNYKDDAGITYRLLRVRMADALTSDVRPDVTILFPNVRVNGEDATADLRVRVTDLRSANETLFDQNLRLILRKEKLHKHLVFTTREWRITGVEGVAQVIERY